MANGSFFNDVYTHLSSSHPSLGSARSKITLVKSGVFYHQAHRATTRPDLGDGGTSDACGYL